MLHYLLSALAWVLSKLPKNGFLWAYTIKSLEGEPYITRVLLPRIGKERRMIHRIHKSDDDRDMHNHPWDRSRTRILAGGYLEERAVKGVVGATEWNWRRPGDRAELDAQDFHRIAIVAPRTWTLFTVGARVQVWGFSTPGGFVDYETYFAQRGHAYEGVKS
jgi:hypothetical protein